MVDNSSNLSTIRMWKIKQKVCPKTDILTMQLLKWMNLDT